MTSTLLDEIMGTAVAIAIQDDPKPFFTVNLNVDFVRPIAVPGVMIVNARVESREGRKISVVAEMLGVPKGGEEGKVEVCAKGRALFVTPRGSAEQRRPNMVDVMGKLF
jgi:acyl-coenzyme A thioesterase PaaI-like protein